MRRSKVAALAAAIACILSAGSPSWVSAATPNQSVFLWKPGTAHTGVLKDGVFTRKRTMDMNGVSLAAASRSSLALYARGTGRLRTGTFRAGVYTPVETITVRSGFTHMAASCDTLILYNAGTGRLLVGTLNGGRFRNRTSSMWAPQALFVFAGCRRFMAGWPLSGLDSNTSLEGGVASGGDVSVDSKAKVRGPFGPAAATRDAFLWVTRVVGGFGVWGPLAPFDGRAPWSDHSTTFGAWDLIAGNASTILFLHRDGVWCGWTMAAGIQTGGSCGDGELGTGWTIVTGGR